MAILLQQVIEHTLGFDGDERGGDMVQYRIQ